MRDLHKLEIFVRVVEAGSFSKAAEALYMSQSAVSQHMQDLENSLGAVLFRRERRGVSLTESGQTLYGYAQQIFQLIGEAELAVTDVTNLRNGQVTIGATPGVSAYLLPEWVQSFRAIYPHLRIALHTDTTARVVVGIQQRQLALGIIEGELDDLDTDNIAVVRLHDVDQYVIVGPQHPWWERDEVAISELDGQGIVTRQSRSQTRAWLEQMFQQYQIRPTIVAEFDNIESIKRMTISGMCMSILPEYVVRNEQELGLVRALPLRGHPLQRALKLIWHQTAGLSPVARAFVAHLNEVFGRPELAASV